MRISLLIPLVTALAAAAGEAQTVSMPSGDYVVQARDSAHAGDVGVAGWPFVLKGNGNFTLTSPDSLSFAGKLVQKDGLATLTDQTCADSGVYVVRAEHGGYAFDVRSEACPGRDSSWTKLLFVPTKSRKP